MQNKNFELVINTLHKPCRDKTKTKLYKRLMSARLRWAKENGCSPERIEELIIEYIGDPCFFCNEILKADNISLDHKIPKHRGGSESLENLTIICDRCNRRKGVLTSSEYAKILVLLQSFEPVAKKYVLRKLGTKDRYGG